MIQQYMECGKIELDSRLCKVGRSMDRGEVQAETSLRVALFLIWSSGLFSSPVNVCISVFLYHLIWIEGFAVAARSRPVKLLYSG